MVIKMIKKTYANDMILCSNAEFCRKDKIGASIIFVYEDSDVFYPARLLKYAINCLCFTSKEPIAKGDKIYIFTQDFPIEAFNHRIYEGCFAQVEECKKKDHRKKGPTYLIRGKSVIAKNMSLGPNEFSVSLGPNEFSVEVF